MTSNKYFSVLKIIIVASCSYSIFRLFIAPNENKDLHLSVTLITGTLAALLTIWENRRR